MPQKRKISSKDKRHFYEFGEEHPVNSLVNTKLEDRLLSQIQKKQKAEQNANDQLASSLKISTNYSQSQFNANSLFKELFFASEKPKKVDLAEKNKEKDIIFETAKKCSLDEQMFAKSQSDVFYRESLKPLILKANSEMKSGEKNGVSKYMLEKKTSLGNYDFSLYSNQDILDSLERGENPLCQVMSSLCDTLYCNSNFLSNRKSIRKIYLEHVTNYLEAVYDIQSKHNSKTGRGISIESSDEGSEAELSSEESNLNINENEQKIKTQEASNDDVQPSIDTSEEPVTDSGFTQAKVLILCPFKNFAYEIVKTLIKKSKTFKQLNIKRFEQEFSPLEAISDNNKSIDDIDIMFSGNLDDNFKFGLSFNRSRVKPSLKLFTDFYKSDIIVASPLALRKSIESNSCDDFLSSIQIAIVDGIDGVMMQNWEHLEFCFAHLNNIPQHPGSTDFSRLREIYADANSKLTRQTLMFSSIQTPIINSLFNRQCNHLAGKCIIKQQEFLPMTLTTINQEFVFFPAGSPSSYDDDRFNFFVKQIYPQLIGGHFSDSKLGHCLIFISSYLDYVRVKDFFDKNDVDFDSLTEYSSGPDITRTRGWFYNGQVRFLLVTERFMFYKQYKLRGIRKLFFYSLPEYASIYKALGEMIGDYQNSKSSDCSCSALWSKYDLLKMERILGSEYSGGVFSKEADFVIKSSIND